MQTTICQKTLNVKSKILFILFIACSQLWATKPNNKTELLDSIASDSSLFSDKWDSVLSGEQHYVLHEIEVIGYGTQKKRDLTGSVASLKFEENTAHHQSNSVAEELTGKLAGVHIISTDGSLDANAKITIRGGGSITQDNSPLYIIDGFPANSIEDIPLSEIKSIDVLKDASATAIYGAQGANGVIIITTFGGKINKTSVSYNSYYGIRWLSRELKVLSPYDYALLQYELASSDDESLVDYSKLFGNYSDIDLYKEIPQTDWQNKVFGEIGFLTSQNIIIKGGNEKTDFRINYTYDDNNGIMVGSNLEKHSAGINLNTKLSNRCKIEINTTYIHKKSLGAGTSSEGSTSTSRLKNAVTYAPLDCLAFSNLDDATYETGSSLYDPLSIINDDYRKMTSTLLRGNVALSLFFLPQKNLIWRNELSGCGENDETQRGYGITTSQAQQYGQQPLAYILNEENNKLREMSSLTFDRQLNKSNNIKLMIGEELSETNKNYTYNESRYFPTYISPKEALASMSLGTAQPISTYTYPADRMFSLFCRTNYSYEGKYLAAITFRSDRSSKFADGHQWGYFPAGAVAWRFSDEKFMETSRKWFNNGKIRASYGLSGNNRIKNSLYQLVYTAGGSDDDAIYFNENSQSFLTYSSILANPDLKWETTTTRDIGLDLDFFDNKLSLVADIYYNTTSDLLIESAIATESGYSSMMRNIGETSNKGLEIAINGVLYQNKNWKVTGGANVAFNRNRIEKLGNQNSTLVSSGWAGSEISSDYILQEGKSTGQMYGYVTDGYYSIDDFNYNSSTHSYTLKPGVANDADIIAANGQFGPGCIKLKDLDGDGIVSENDRTIIGNANPDATGGFSFKINYKKWDFGIDAYWSLGNDIYNANKIEFTTTNKYKYRNMTSEMESGKRWTNIDANGNRITNPDDLATLNKNTSIWSPNMGRYIFHSWAVEDGSFLRLSKLTLGYTMPQRWTKNIKIQDLRIYASVNNIYCFTKYTGYDPEVDSKNTNSLTPGVDYSAYPRSRVFCCGLNINF